MRFDRFGMVSYGLVGKMNLAVPGYPCNFQAAKKLSTYFSGQLDDGYSDNRATSVQLGWG